MLPLSKILLLSNLRSHWHRARSNNSGRRPNFLLEKIDENHTEDIIITKFLSTKYFIEDITKGLTTKELVEEFAVILY